VLFNSCRVYKRQKITSTGHQTLAEVTGRLGATNTTPSREGYPPEWLPSDEITLVSGKKCPKTGIRETSCHLCVSLSAKLWPSFNARVLPCLGGVSWEKMWPVSGPPGYPTWLPHKTQSSAAAKPRELVHGFGSHQDPLTRCKTT